MMPNRTYRYQHHLMQLQFPLKPDTFLLRSGHNSNGESDQQRGTESIYRDPSNVLRLLLSDFSLEQKQKLAEDYIRDMRAWAREV